MLGFLLLLVFFWDREVVGEGWGVVDVFLFFFVLVVGDKVVLILELEGLVWFLCVKVFIFGVEVFRWGLRWFCGFICVIVKISK